MADSDFKTAQTVFKEMLRDEIAPALRQLGFKGSNRRYLKLKDGFVAEISFQSSKFNSKRTVHFDANISLVHTQTMREFEEANQAARDLGRELEFPDLGFHLRLSQIIGRKVADFFWKVESDGPTQSVSSEVIDSIVKYYMPMVDREIHRPLPSPKPPRKRRKHFYHDEGYFLRELYGSN